MLESPKRHNHYQLPKGSLSFQKHLGSSINALKMSLDLFKSPDPDMSSTLTKLLENMSVLNAAEIYLKHPMILLCLF